MNARRLSRLIPAVDAADGAGVKLRRSLGATPDSRVDPFLLLDEFFSDDPDDYIGGFPPHPHRGFETVTYMLAGHMQHRDHLGNTGDLGPGDVQWMTAGRGIIHSEMPQQSDGRMRGFQLWLNLPARDKMRPAAYRDIPATAIPVLEPGDGIVIRLIAGELALDGRRHRGAVTGTATEAIYADLKLPAEARFTLPLPTGHQGFVYPYEGDVHIGQAAVPRQHAGVFSRDGELLSLRAGPDGARLLLLSGRPLDEPLVQYGPFVMSTREEIEQALRDYRNGTLTAATPAA